MIPQIQLVPELNSRPGPVIALKCMITFSLHPLDNWKEVGKTGIAVSGGKL